MPWYTGIKRTPGHRICGFPNLCCLSVSMASPMCDTEDPSTCHRHFGATYEPVAGGYRVAGLHFAMWHPRAEAKTDPDDTREAEFWVPRRACSAACRGPGTPPRLLAL